MADGYTPADVELVEPDDDGRVADPCSWYYQGDYEDDVGFSNLPCLICGRLREEHQP